MAEVATQVTDKSGLLSKEPGMNLFITNFRPDFQGKVGLPLTPAIIKVDKLDDNKENEGHGEVSGGDFQTCVTCIIVYVCLDFTY